MGEGFVALIHLTVLFYMHYLAPGDDPLCPRVMGVVDPPEDCWKPPCRPAATTSKARKSSSARSIGSSNGRKKVVKKADSVKRLKVGTRSSYDLTDPSNSVLFLKQRSIESFVPKNNLHADAPKHIELLTDPV